MTRVCRVCKSEQIEEDITRGDLVCTDCGAVLEENVIVSEAQFHETGGGATVIGQFVGADNPNHFFGIGSYNRTGKSSREITLQNARHRMQEVASQLRIDKSCVDMAFSFYKRALGMGITKGRRNVPVIACCLYIAARLKSIHLLLLDFSDAVQVNVYELGKFVSFFCRKLYLNLPPNDPSLYVMRFAAALKFGDKEHDARRLISLNSSTIVARTQFFRITRSSSIVEVAKIALRLVTRMKRDWLSIGRRPTGICGAALLMAARYYQFNRTLADIVSVVHIGENVVRKRLSEFEATPSADLTLEEFLEVDLETEMDPPSLIESRTKLKEKEQQICDQLESSFDAELQEVESALERERERREKKNPYLRMARAMPSPPPDEATTSHMSPAKRLAAANVSTGLAGVDIVGSIELQEAETFLTDELLNELNRPSTSDSPEQREAPRETNVPLGPSLESLGIRRVQQQLRTAAATVTDTSSLVDNELDLTGIDDGEIDSYLFSPDETAQKERIWMRINGTFVEEQERRRAERAERTDAAAAAGTGRPKNVRRAGRGEGARRDGRSRPAAQQHASGMDAITMVIQEKKLSNKIDYDVLRALGGDLKLGVLRGTKREAEDVPTDAFALPLPTSAPAPPNMDEKKTSQVKEAESPLKKPCRVDDSAATTTDSAVPTTDSATPTADPATEQPTNAATDVKRRYVKPKVNVRAAAVRK